MTDKSWIDESDELARIEEVFEQWGVAKVTLIPSGVERNITLPDYEPGKFYKGMICSLSLDQESILP